MHDSRKPSLVARLTAILLCFLISPVPTLMAQGQRAGQVGALRPDATRNTQNLKVNDAVAWNDLLKTMASGRLRANLTDGSMLSMGSNSEMRVTRHDATSQQTEIDLTFGRLRNRVVQLTKPGAKYEVKTPHAVIGVIGTDFYVFVDADRTLVICYTGRISVTPNNQNSHEVQAGQMIEIRSGGVTGPGPTPLAVQQDSIESTTVGESLASRDSDGGTKGKLPIILIGIITAVAIGIVAGTGEKCPSTSTSSSSSGCSTSTSSP